METANIINLIVIVMTDEQKKKKRRRYLLEHEHLVLPYRPALY